MDALDHPAVTVALDALADADRDLTPVSVVIRDDIAAVVIDGNQGRYIVFVHPDGDQWATHGTMFGAPRPSGPRNDRTSSWEPLQRLGTRFRSANADQSGEGWFAVIGRAAHDAVCLTVSSSLEKQVVPIAADGLAFAVIRAYGSDEPHITVTTRDGRAIAVAPIAA
ncbi:hypothetical protein [Nocardia amamiensis]|uniref:hypothetical protein n=1 Tax=Nocardia amamiensis TaxID=404578 RepID=UPI00082959AC|nr:hypothetical protein [Nocardia amamiensis]